MKLKEKLINKFQSLSKLDKIIVIIIMIPLSFWTCVFSFIWLKIGIEDLLRSDESNTASVEKYNLEQEKLNNLEKYILEQEKLKKENENSKLYKEEDPETKDAEVNQKEVESETEKENEKSSPFGIVTEKPVMNGFKSERIGMYAEVMAGGVEINKENLIQFYKEVVKDSNYKWVTINIDGKKGIQFAGSNNYFTYGTIDNEGCIIESEGNGYILGDTINYE